MYIDHDNLKLSTESDVEQKVIMPLLTGPIYLGLAQEQVFTKKYLAPTILDKLAEKTSGYFPDYSIWIHGFLVMIVEAKSPEVRSEVGYREASLYARHLNQNYPADFNPCRFIISTNGTDLLFGDWDCNPIITAQITNLRAGSLELDNLNKHCHSSVLQAFALARSN
jgi:type I site-specific restriction endonuclease